MHDACLTEHFLQTLVFEASLTSSITDLQQLTWRLDNLPDVSTKRLQSPGPFEFWAAALLEDMHWTMCSSTYPGPCHNLTPDQDRSTVERIQTYSKSTIFEPKSLPLSSSGTTVRAYATASIPRPYSTTHATTCPGYEEQIVQNRPFCMGIEQILLCLNAMAIVGHIISDCRTSLCVILRRYPRSTQLDPFANLASSQTATPYVSSCHQHSTHGDIIVVPYA